MHRVYLDDRLVLTARDAALDEGTADIIMYRARADYDNVIVTPSPFTTIYTQNFSTPDIDSWNSDSGLWQSTGGVFRQSSTVGYGRAFVGAGVGDQIVQARVRPTSFAGPDDWVGVMARYQDPQNYLYVSLRNRDVISLWRRGPGGLQNLANRPFTVTTGTWYVVRVEIVAGLTRVFVNNQLQLSSNADPGPSNPYLDVDISHVGLITNDATADFDNFFAYQPSALLLRPARESRRRAQRIRVQQLAAEHHDARLAQVADALRRIAFDQHEVGHLADLDRAGGLVLADELRGHDGRRGQRLGRREAGLHVDLELVDQLDAGAIGAGNDGHAGLVHLAEQLRPSSPSSRGSRRASDPSAPRSRRGGSRARSTAAACRRTARYDGERSPFSGT